MSDHTDRTRTEGRKAKYVLTLVAAALTGSLVTAQLVNPAFSKAPSKPLDSQIAGARDIGMPGGFAELIEAVKPAVVNISVSGKLAGMNKWQGPKFDMPSPEFELPPGSRFEEYFRRFFEQPSGKWQRELPPAEIQAVGSGFIIDPAGYVVTNHHVINGANEITVILHDGTRHAAEVKGHDSKTDLALLKIDTKKPLPYVSFGDSDATRVGDWVVAIGNPFGLGGTATTGIVSARGRDINSGPFDDYIQIDAPINRGNSGGPLFDISGKVIGVNAAIFSPHGGNVGIGFAIPSSLAQSVVGQLQAHGKVERGWFGVKIQTVTEDVAKGLGLKEAKGALVAEVVAGSPAAKAGIETGDVIMEYNDKDVARMKDLPRMVAETKAKTNVNIKVWRKGEEHMLRAVIAKMPGDEVITDAGSDARPKGKLGLSLAPITPELRQQYRLSDSTEGAVIVGVRPNSPAAKKGLRIGDVITMVGQKKVSNPQEIVNEVKRATKSERDSVLLLVKRGDDQHFVALNAG
ncbi:MAG: DegQ family serine endoprotease [Acidiferrobacterales bacterium]